MQLDPTKRLEMEKIVNHPWMQEDTPSKEEIFQALEQRKAEII